MKTNARPDVHRRPLLLLVDDEPGVRGVIERFADRAGFDALAFSSGHAAIEQLRRHPADLAFIDLRMPDVDGLNVLRQFREIAPLCEVALMTGFATIDSAVEAIKLGAIDYLCKPIDFDRLEELLLGVHKQVERRQRLLKMESDLARRFEFYGMIGRSAVMQETFNLIRRLAPHVRNALITGETGTRKELAARALHKLGQRRERRLVAVNCSAVVETLFETEFFGHVRGAFTGAAENKAGMFETADGGTFFLDEVGELPLGVQGKLYAFSSSGRCNVWARSSPVKSMLRSLRRRTVTFAPRSQLGDSAAISSTASTLPPRRRRAASFAASRAS
ncbi:MAG: sigma-54-dependent Fis family transcriptional regulator [Acidobacteria bacterium]|nr:sigma-54-dependent Fis family transcriptional regulator [Acidobacteriota bacterium]